MTKSISALLSCTFLLATPAFADMSEACLADLSGERVTFVVPNAPGGGYDTYARALAPEFEAATGSTVRVVNNSGGGGLVARSLVLNSSSDDVFLLIENYLDLIINIDTGVDSSDGVPHFQMERFRPLGLVNFGPDAWLGVPGTDIFDPSITTMVSSQGGIDGSLLAFVAPAIALGIEPEVIAGYDGTSEMASAVLRGETDLTTMSLTSALKKASGGDLQILMTISDGPVAGHEDIPYLAGEGSVSWARTEGLDPAERDRLRGFAVMAATIGGEVRGFLAGAHLSEARLGCLSEAMDVAIASPVFAETAMAQGRPVNGVSAADTVALVERATAAFLTYGDEYNSLLEAVQ